MMRKILLIQLLLLSWAFPSSAQKFVLDYEVECLGTGNQGTQLFKVWAYGKKQDEAIELAKLYAVHAIIFKGIKTGKGCASGSLIPEKDAPDALRLHSGYFEKFFGIRRLKRNGEYKLEPRAAGKQYHLYVQLSSDGSISAADRKKVGNRYKMGVAVSVSRDALRQKLEKDDIIKALNHGF